MKAKAAGRQAAVYTDGRSGTLRSIPKFVAERRLLSPPSRTSGDTKY